MPTDVPWAIEPVLDPPANAEGHVRGYAGLVSSARREEPLRRSAKPIVEPSQGCQGRIGFLPFDFLEQPYGHPAFLSATLLTPITGCAESSNVVREPRSKLFERGTLVLVFPLGPSTPLPHSTSTVRSRRSSDHAASLVTTEATRLAAREE